MSSNGNASFPNASVPNSILESPFLSQSETVNVGDTPTSADEYESAFSRAMYSESPFPSVYEMETDSRTIDPHDEEILEFFDELYDEEFDTALLELLTAAETLYQDRLDHEYGDVVSRRIAIQRQFENYTHPAVRALEGFLDELSHELEQHDLDRMTVQDFNHLVDQFDAPQTPVPPEFEQFIGKAKKKAKAAVKRAVNTAKQQATSAVKKGAQAARAVGKAALKGTCLPTI